MELSDFVDVLNQDEESLLIQLHTFKRQLNPLQEMSKGVELIHSCRREPVGNAMNEFQNPDPW
jgi:hypothetical protein